MEQSTEYISRRVSVILGIPKGKTEKVVRSILQDEGSKSTMSKFLDGSGKKFILLIPSAPDAVQVSDSLPVLDLQKKKIVVALRVAGAGAISLPNLVSGCVTFSEITRQLVHLLFGLCDSVFGPVVDQSFPERVLNEGLLSQVGCSLRTSIGWLESACGSLDNRVVLLRPMTKDIENCLEGSRRREAQANLEAVVMSWIKQVRGVIQLDTLDLLNNPMFDYEPMHEIGFWDNRASTLLDLHAQLGTETTKRVLGVLLDSSSTYLPSYERMYADLEKSLEQATSNKKFLDSLIPYINELCKGASKTGSGGAAPSSLTSKDPKASNYSGIMSVFDPLLHVLLLIFRHSKYCNTLPRILLLLREVCNAIIHQSIDFVDGPMIFQLIANEEAFVATEKLETVAMVCNTFLTKYGVYRDLSQQKIPKISAGDSTVGKVVGPVRLGGNSQVGWVLSHSSIFGKFDNFRDRVNDALDYVKVVQQYNKLEKLEIGGTKGKQLSDGIQEILREFRQTVTVFQAITYDMMNIGSSDSFQSDIGTFRVAVKELDRRLASIMFAAFEDQDSIMGQIKVLESFACLQERRLIALEFERCYGSLIQKFRADLLLVQSMFLEKRAAAAAMSYESPSFPGMPPASGAIYWSRSLAMRLITPMQMIKHFEGFGRGRAEELREIDRLYSQFMSSIQEFESHIFNIWSATEVKPAYDALNNRLLERNNETGLLYVNLSENVERMLEEVRYMIGCKMSNISETALAMHERASMYRLWQGQLEYVTDTYNRILAELLPVEVPLLQDKVQKLDAVLAPGLTSIPWTEEKKAAEFIQQAMTMTKELSTIVDVLKSNLRKITDILSRWAKTPLFEKRGKPATPDEADAVHKAFLGTAIQQMSDDAKEITRCVRDSAEAARLSRSSSMWRLYTGFLSSVVIGGMSHVVAINLDALKNGLYPQTSGDSQVPFFEIRVELHGGSLVFDPPLVAPVNSPSVCSVLENWMTELLSISTLMPRLDTGNGDYVIELRDDYSLSSAMAELIQRVSDTCGSCHSYVKELDRFEFLWREPVELGFNKFLQSDSKYIVEDKEIKAASGGKDDSMSFTEIMRIIGVDIGDPLPPLSRFEQELVKIDEIRDAVQKLKPSLDVSWLRISCANIRQILLQHSTARANVLTSYLKAFVEARIDSCASFVDKVHSGLTAASTASAADARQQLYATMTHIKDVKVSMNAIKLLFPPLTAASNLLKKYGINLSDRHQHVLEQYGSLWDEIVKLAFNEKERILPLQNQELTNVKQQIDAFSNRVFSFRQAFDSVCPSKPGVPPSAAYSVLDEHEKTARELIDKSKDVANLELLFDLALSGHRPVKAVLDEVNALRTLWRTVDAILTTFDDWKSTEFDKVDSEDLILRVKDLMNQVKTLPKEMRGYPLYNWLLDEIKMMQTVLPLISELRSDTMRERHWVSVMAIGKAAFSRGAQFRLKDILDMKLHKHADEVSEVVAQSQKEFKIEKKLNTIIATWSKMPIEFDRSRDGVVLLAGLTDILEVLEVQSADVAGMISQGRFIEFIKDSVTEWATTLRTVDSVLNIWSKVQRNWCRLEPIFLQSEDIRSQLPDETKIFELLDQEWRDLMASASKMTTVVQVCCVQGREENLKRINESIEKCQRSLSDYLEQKKKLFPRFYFVSNQALLDILSNGNKPLVVAKYMGDCFDGIKSLNFDKDPQGGRIASGMRAKDGEYVPFHNDYHIQGPVEGYLSGLERHIRYQLRDILETARASADNWEVDKPREIWLQDYCTQLALLVTQMVWTEETTRAFDELESGNESSMKEYKRICDERIEKLIKQVQHPLTPDLRNKIITVITIDVHARDMIDKFIQMRLTDSSAFAWQSQLRFYWQSAPTGSRIVSHTPQTQNTCVIRIADWTTVYAYEYIGNCGRLVITPLTDRCYITLTQALNLIMGGAPAGPAGTGKTETTKDLGRAVGIPVVVFNCSDQMTYLSMAQIFMGLAQSGAWGCFDEFNRISIEVLSVVSSQVKIVLDALREGARTAQFMDDEIRIVESVGFFITMNPGYAGRTELPENLKALFRSCAMVVPDINFICENMLMSEGFVVARSLARKFVCLYSLCSQLLSPQQHYDWGLRAVKSLLRQAGSLKRAEPNMDEYPLLMRALRDFNTPKIVSHDQPIFLRLVQDLFPGISADSKTSESLAATIKKVCKRTNLQADAGFVTKTIALLDLLRVRHCVFIIGPPGSGKTEVWKTLMASLKDMGEDGNYETLNPKAITTDELYGIVTKSKEWKDGALSVLMRNMSREINGYKASHMHKWIVLDGDIDAKWIESMNTVMDDNKVLTLVSNERIPFAPTMRLLFEVQDMKHASPATVSRGGVLYINETDIGWKPFVESWRAKLDPVAQNALYLLFTSYFEQNIDYIRRSFPFTCPMTDIGLIQTICSYVDALIASGDKNTQDFMKTASQDDLKNIYESFFFYAFMWSIGGAVGDKASNPRKAFNSWLRTITKVRLPNAGECMDYRFDVVTQQWLSWDSFVTPYQPVAERPFHKVVVSNSVLEKLKYNLSLNLKRRKPTLLCGVPGSGKSAVVRDFLSELGDEYVASTVNLNSYSDSYSVQVMIEGSLEKRTARTFGAPGNRKAVFYIDDLNMPYVDAYDTQSAIMLLFQMMSHGSVFDRNHLDERKELQDVLFVSCMNPKVGSLNINARLQRHYSVLTTYTLTSELISQVYGQILGHHLKQFDSPIQSLEGGIIKATSEIIASLQVHPNFLPSARKFHCQYNMRDLSSITQSLLSTNPAFYKGSPTTFARVWLHECERVFSDKLIDLSDKAELKSIMDKAVRKHLPNVDANELFAPDLIFTSFVSAWGGNDRAYLPIKNQTQLKECLEAKLAEYNESHPEMNLVLFDDAMAHITRVARIVEQPGGNALLVGVGGSGKQSLAKLACFLARTDVLSIVVGQSYGLAEFRNDLQEFYKKAAVKPGSPHAFLITDSQITDERFLVYINDLLATGNIPDLFTKEDYDSIFNSIRTAARAAGVADERAAMHQFFIDKVKQNLHVVICHSPVGETLRSRARKFPCLVSCSTIDVFYPWTKDALTSVAKRFISTIPMPSEEYYATLSTTVAACHLSIDEASAKYLKAEGRRVYTTPKSFLELIAFFQSLLSQKRASVESNIDRLEKGLNIMEQVKGKVQGLQEMLNSKMVVVEEKRKAADVLIQQVSTASNKANAEKAIAAEEAAKASALAEEANKIKAVADQELQEALPAMQAAQKAVECLDKKAIQELKSLAKPPPECAEVTKVVLIMLKNEKKTLDWKAAQRMMNNPQQFLEDVKHFNADDIADWVLEMIAPIIGQSFFNFETMKTKSSAAANLTEWAVNIVAYNKIYKKVKPLIDKATDATKAKEAAEDKLRVVMARVKDLQDKVAALEKTLGGAVAEKQEVEAEANAYKTKLDLANRLVGGLADEFTRWSREVATLKNQNLTTIGDSLLASAFVSYAGPFSASFRLALWKNTWLPMIINNKIPISEGVDPLAVLASEAAIATWKNQSLPADQVSVENAAIVTACTRWPLIIDPQLQGVRWIKQKCGEDLVVVQFSQSNWLQKTSNCVQMGGTLLIENAGQELDPLLDPLLSRSIIRRGKNRYAIMLGGEEVEYDPKFRLYIQTKLVNPHYRPEVAAQCTILNFIVTPEGLEDQVLAMVVNAEKPELEQQKQDLVRQQNEFKVSLAQLEDNLLARLSGADPGTILDNTELVLGLEQTKKTASEIVQQTILSKKTEITINELRDLYRPVAQEGSMLFFIISSLSSVEHMYQYSLESFVSFLLKAIERTQHIDSPAEMSVRLINSIRKTVFSWVSRGLFEKHKLVFSSALTFRLLQRGKLKDSYNAQLYDFVLRAPLKGGVSNSLSDWLPDQCWSAIMRLSEIQGFETLPLDMEKNAPGRFKEWFNENMPESVKLPLDWKKVEQIPLQKLAIMRCLRPDRMGRALSNWISSALPDGKQFTECDASKSFFDILSSAFEDSTSSSPIFFILSPGSDPVKDVERLGRKLVQLTPGVNYHNVAMGQGQEKIALDKLELGHKQGHWVMLQNIHLMPRWCVELERKLDTFASEGSHPNFRCFLSADPSVSIPIGILERSIKLTNEPPQGLQQNLRRAFAFFSKEQFEERDTRVKVILSTLCHFHAVMVERKKFGALGFNMSYPFSIGDLRDSASVLYNYMENQNPAKVPWDDLKYIFGEIMYGGHIVDDLDRRLCKTYLDFYMTDALFDETDLVPYSTAASYKAVSGGTYSAFVDAVENMPAESPVLFGLHPNAEVGFRSAQCQSLFAILRDLESRNSAASSGASGDDLGDRSTLTPAQRAEQLCNEILEEMGDKRFAVEDIARSMSDEERGPYQYVFLQECECMNILVSTISKSLSELRLAFKGEITMTEQMDKICECLYLERLPDKWKALSFPSNRPLSSWLVSFKERYAQLADWVLDPTNIPKVVDLNKLFKPQSLLTAIKQVACQKQGLELDKLYVATEVTKKDKSQIESASKEGAYIYGTYLEGAKWDIAGNCLEESKPKEMFFKMPVIQCRAALEDQTQGAREAKGVYWCPMYCTPQRRPNYVFSAQLRTKQPPAKWVLAGVALILDVVAG